MSGQLIDRCTAFRWANRQLAGRARHIACFAVIVFGAIVIGTASHARTVRDAQVLAERGPAQIHDVGRNQDLVDFGRPDGGFTDAGLCTFCEDVSGVVVARGGDPNLDGMIIKDMRGPERALLDMQGKRFGLSRSGGWIGSSWPNPVTERIELKSVYLLKVDDQAICGSGCYWRSPR